MSVQTQVILLIDALGWELAERTGFWPTVSRSAAPPHDTRLQLGGHPQPVDRRRAPGP